MIRSTSVVSSATAFSRLLGLAREQVMAYFFGASMATDAFVTAFRVPNLLRDMFAEGALASAFIPVFKRKLISDSRIDAFRLASILMTTMLIVVGTIVILGIIAAPALIYITAHGFTSDPIKFNLTVSLTRIMFVYLLLVSLSATVMGMLNSFGRFGIPALSSAMFNLGMIATVVALYGWFEQPVYTLAVGVVVGGVGQLAIQLPLLYRMGYRFKPIISFLDDGLKQIVRLVTPMIIGMSAGRVNILLSTLIASFLMEGSISFLNYSFRLMHFPMGVFAVALGTVALPKVSELVSKNDRDAVNRTFHEAIGLNLLILIPSAVFLAIFGKELVTLVFQWGAFSTLDAENTALALLHYSYGLVGFATVRVIVPFFYAHDDSRLPMKISLITVAVNIALYYPLVKILDFAGLAAATSVAGLLNCAALIYFLPSKGIEVHFGRLWLEIVRMVTAAILACYLGRLIPISYSSDLVWIARLADLAIPAVTAVLLYILFCFIFRVGEIRRVFRFVKRT